MLAGGLNTALACLNHAEHIMDAMQACPFDIYLQHYVWFLKINERSSFDHSCVPRSLVEINK